MKVIAAVVSVCWETYTENVINKVDAVAGNSGQNKVREKKQCIYMNYDYWYSDDLKTML